MAQEMEMLIRAIPVPKHRHRTRVVGGQIISYTPRKVREWEERVAWEAKAAGWKPVPAGLQVEVRIDLWTSARWPGDIDNLAKSILDGLNGVGYEDDRQVRRLVVAMHQAGKGSERVYVRVSTLAEAASA